MSTQHVLHSYKLTRFSNHVLIRYFFLKFYTLTNLQGSQTIDWQCFNRSEFYTLTNLQGSQTILFFHPFIFSFTLLQTYKVLKQSFRLGIADFGFTLLQTYKVLKLQVKVIRVFIVLHSYKLTRFSNCQMKL